MHFCRIVIVPTLTPVDLLAFILAAIMADIFFLLLLTASSSMPQVKDGRLHPSVDVLFVSAVLLGRPELFGEMYSATDDGRSRLLVLVAPVVAPVLLTLNARVQRPSCRRTWSM
jgi:hypothetical protein